MSEKFISLSDFTKQNHIGRGTILSFVENLDFADEQEFGKIEKRIIDGKKVFSLSEKQQNFLFEKMPNLKIRLAPEDYRPFDTFARENHVRMPAILNFLNSLSFTERQKFGELLEFKDMVGKVNFYLSPAQQNYLKKNDPHFFTDFAPEGFLTFSAFARKNGVGHICVKV